MREEQGQSLLGEAAPSLCSGCPAGPLGDDVGSLGAHAPGQAGLSCVLTGFRPALASAPASSALLSSPLLAWLVLSTAGAFLSFRPGLPCHLLREALCTHFPK